MIAVLLVCAAPVVASYFAYFVIRPQARTNYSELIQPPRPLPASLPFATPADARSSPLVAARPVAARRRRRRRLRLGAASATSGCSASCTRRSAAEKERVDKVWLVDDAVEPRRADAGRDRAPPPTAAPSGFAPATVLRTDRAALLDWLAPAAGKALEDHLYIVDPLGDWMMRVPADPDPARLKRDVEKLLRASAGWDRPGR